MKIKIKFCEYIHRYNVRDFVWPDINGIIANNKMLPIPS